jgi:carbon dioxide concentrating mechanism protein CcmN
VGDVTIADSVAIAPGVVLHASPGSRIVVGKGACLAAGVCIQSRSGVLTVAAGVSLGANVLVVGNGTVGENACVSAGSTLINPQVSAHDVVPPNVLINGLAIGNSASPAKPLANLPANPPANGRAATNGFASGVVSGASPSGTLNNGVQLGYNTHQNGYHGGVSSNPASHDLSNGTLDRTGQATENDSSSLSLRSYDRVYGREQVSQLISALFPGRQSLNGSSSNDQSSNGHFSKE